MSENIPSTSSHDAIPPALRGSSSPPPPPPQPLRHRKSRKKLIDKAMKLPAPPPDPNASTENASKEDRDDFLAYLDSLHRSRTAPGYSRSTSIFAPVIATEDAFDHLEKLYKLMEQMLELKEQNAKLHRKVRDLEHLNNLEKMHKQMEEAIEQGQQCPELDRDTAFAETILESILAETPKGSPSRMKAPSASSRLRQSISRRPRNRSGSVSIAALEHDQLRASRRASTCVDDRAINKNQSSQQEQQQSKVSKWTKVKAAFKWEKASPGTVSDAKSQDSGIGGMVPVNFEVARYLRVPSTTEDSAACTLGHSPADSGAAEISTPRTLSTASSTEDFHRQHDLRSPCEDLCSDDEHPTNHIPQTKDGSHKSNKAHHHKTPWAKMKDIIQTRNSFKKKHRLSTHSDEIQIDVELCTDNEDNVFDEDDDPKSSQNPSPQPKLYQRLDSSEVPPEIVARYQKMAAEDGDVLGNSDSKKISKWTRVKKAFLTTDEVNDNTPQNQTQKDYLRAEEDPKTVQAEIRQNYKQLQKKLSLEFKEKLSEWERMKQNSPGTSNPSSSCGFVDENRDQAFMRKMEEWERIKSQPSVKIHPNIQLTSEERLPPEFRKKLQEWEKIRKCSGKEMIPKKKLAEVPRWKSLSGQRPDYSPPIEYPLISDDFKRKLEEWKQMKSSGSSNETKDLTKTSSPKLGRKHLSPKHSKKQKDSHDKELQWFEKELGKIEKEKQRLERERQKFLEREESSSKLKSSVGGGPKKEILIHTPSGFYRFEGISRKFAQKLYEWEKAQGIGPESSTFALLNSSLVHTPNSTNNNSGKSPPLFRSKSADSIAISALNLTCPLMSHQPSSLSLNDMEDLEKECLADCMDGSDENLVLEEPEALIVEIEDIFEETAVPLRTYTRKVQQPVYQRQEIKAMCEGETCVAPKIRRNESTKAQNSYNLIEEIFNILRNLIENESEIRMIQDDMRGNREDTMNLIKLKTCDEAQRAMAYSLSNKIGFLQEVNSNVLAPPPKEDSDCSVPYSTEVFEVVQDISLEILQLAEKLNYEIDTRDVYADGECPAEIGAGSLTPILEITKEIRTKMLELRRRLSYMCAASDLTAPSKRYRKRSVKKSLSYESQDKKSDVSNLSPKGSVRLYVKSDTSSAPSQGAIKKRIKYRQKSNVQSKSLPDTDDEEDLARNKPVIHKKLCRTRSISENTDSDGKKEMTKTKPKETLVVDGSILEKFVVPTKTEYLSVIPCEPTEEPAESSRDSPVTIFVKTTRKLFTPIAESTTLASKMEESPKPQPINDLETQNDVEFTVKGEPKLPDICVEHNDHSTSSKENKSEVSSSDTISDKNSNDSTVTAITRLPPLPSSPTPQRKTTKEISPSIRLMLTKYNQKISEQDVPMNKSGPSSGSVSPVAWRSPTAVRRVRTQTERYQEELDKLSPLATRREVQKSASVGFLHPATRQVVPRRDSVPSTSQAETNEADKIIKSSSASTITNLPGGQSKLSEIRKKMCDKTVSEVTLRKQDSPKLRQKKLQQAKEEFLKTVPTSPSSTTDTITFPSRNRLSQISVDSESSFDSTCAGALIKSASAGMINIDADVYRQIDSGVHASGYVSLPRSIKKPFLGGKFAFSNIASKFRKVKMRKGKEKMNAVSALCRQSLVVDINRSVSLEEGTSSRNESQNSSRSRELEQKDGGALSLSKSASWIKKPKLFKK